MLDSPMKNIYRIKQDNTALNIVEWRHYGPVVTKMNDTSHIKGDYLLLMLDSPMKNIYRIKQDNTALNIVEWRHYGPVVTKMNDTSHIKGDYKLNNSALE